MFTIEKLNENQQIQQSDHAKSRARAVLHEILALQTHTNNLLQMRQAGEPAAEEVMRAAQIVLCK